ncbi:molybdate ABC transporter substrate-binding protein [Agrilactobacillus yilanensis]|uniref:Molybdate ABC transporter substrate-binding protein n=1 Tax=Agrilactobacillus yilanensis TaxID=2485997 RepID=A0ABW4J468_9LACO|nr:molybdate ABC transporter substrate-binding protein [Agrilactobacillus yilanensis]
MKKKLWLSVAIIFGLLLSLPTLLGAQPAQAASKVTVHYSAAASLKDVLTSISKDYQKKHPKTKIELDFAGSGQIKQKVLSGAPIDGVLTASKADMTALTDAKKAKSTFALLGNSLVLVQSKQQDKLTGDLAAQLNAAEKIALGEPKAVPAGRYATETLDYYKLTDTLQDKYVYANDVRQVLAYVAAGNAQVGFVYMTDAKISDDVRVIKKVSEKSHTPIRYYVGATTTNKKKLKAVKDFNKYLKTKPAVKKFKAAGFSMVK